MGWKIFFSFVFILFSLVLLMFYWFIPIGTNEFMIKQGHSNFSLGNNDSLQFYSNMRYSDSEITYKIDDCTLQKKDDMQRAFMILSEKTILSFQEVDRDEEVSITCDSKNKIEGGLFIAGEGGPTNITVVGEYNVIFNGKILLIRESNCPNPNIALHELLHTLGFDHSQNQNNIMYKISNCKQTIGDDIIERIDELYSVESLPDLVFEDVSAIMHGSYLDINMSLRNNGLKIAKDSEILIYTDGKLVKSVELKSFEVGSGRGIVLTNIWVKKRAVEKIEFLIDSSFDELDKVNNKIILELIESS